MPKRIALFLAVALSWTLYAKSVLVGEFSVPEERGIQSGKFIAPNEDNFHVYLPVLKGKWGTMISVGTFRTLHEAALGNFDRIIQLDYDSTTTAFNRANIEILAQSGNRYDYLRSLMLREDPDELFQHDVLDWQALQDRIKIELGLPIQSITDPTLHTLAKIFNEPVGPRTKSLRMRLFERLKHYLHTPQLRNHSVFGSDVIFRKIQRAARGGNIIPINGSLSGETTFAALGEALRESHEEVTVIDLSNALEHLLPLRPIFNVKHLRSNLEELPFSSDAIVLLTVSPAGLLHLPGKWYYFALPVQDFFQALKRGAFHSRQKYRIQVKKWMKQYEDPNTRGTHRENQLLFSPLIPSCSKNMRKLSS